LNGNNEIFIQELLDYKHPIVLVFYEAQSYSEKVFAAIESLKVDVEVMGGKLILITHAFVKNIQEFSSKNNITVYYDKSNEISETFGLYNPNNTLPSWISGIDDEQAILPAFYVIGADRRVTYHLVDFDVQLFNDPIFLENNFVRNLLSTVHHSEKQFYKFNWQKRVVS
jgi:peroxiredoxin